MRRPANPEQSNYDVLFQAGAHTLPVEDRLQWVAELRKNPETSSQLDRKFLEQSDFKHKSLVEAKRIHLELQAILERFNAPPWHPATFLRAVSMPQGTRALVQHGNARRLVVFGDNVQPDSLQMGDEVFLTTEMNLLIAAAPDSIAPGGEICLFARRLSSGRIVVKIRDEETVVFAPPALLDAQLRPGDPLIWNREAQVAYERVERNADSPCFLESTPRETFADVGGLDHQIGAIQRSVELHLRHGKVAEKYQLRRTGSILLAGPPGTGKTLIAKAFANWLSTLSSSGKSLFMNIKPGALHSMWYAQSEANYREVFRVARDTSAQNPGVPLVMFFDEIDSLGASRGGSHMRVHDNVLTAFITELDGLEARGDILVIGATNRRDALDASILRPGRLGDLILDIPRPNSRGARDILARHLQANIPYAQNGHGADLSATREEILDTAVSRIYAPNADNHLATITFRDGRREPIRAQDLVNGAVLANIIRRAVELACDREVQTGNSGVLADDLELAIVEEFDNAVRSITPANCRQHLPGLPQDMDVTKIELTRRKVSSPHRYTRATIA